MYAEGLRDPFRSGNITVVCERFRKLLLFLEKGEVAQLYANWEIFSAVEKSLKM